MKYSSSADLVYHAPLTFPTKTVDYKSSRRHTDKALKENQVNPFRNNKLSKIHEGDQDLCSAHNNKCVKIFGTKKKSQHQSLLKNLRLSERLKNGKEQKSKISTFSKKNHFTDFKPPILSNLSFSKTGKFKTLRKVYQPPKKKSQRSNKCQNPLELTKQSSRFSWRINQEKENNQQVQSGFINEFQPFGSHRSLKILGNRAPKSETVDFFRKLQHESSDDLVSNFLSQ